MWRWWGERRLCAVVRWDSMGWDQAWSRSSGGTGHLPKSFQAKAACLRQYAKVGGHKLWGGDDFYTALSEHNMVIGREAHDAVAMLACALLAEGARRGVCWNLQYLAYWWHCSTEGEAFHGQEEVWVYDECSWCWWARRKARRKLFGKLILFQKESWDAIFFIDMHLLRLKLLRNLIG